MTEIYRMIFIVGAILCGVMVIVSVMIFILMNIPRVISDLSGKTARRAIANIRQKNEAGGDSAYRSSTAKIGRIKVEDKLTQSGRIAQKKSHMGHPVETAKISTKKLMEDAQNSSATTVLNENQYAAPAVPAGNETTVLGAQAPAGNETTVLGAQAPAGNETTVLGAQAPAAPVVNETTVLGEGGTTVLSGMAPPVQTIAQNAVFVIEKDITYIHSDEMIA